MIYLGIQDGESALYIASNEGHGRVVELLLQKEDTDVSISKKVGHSLITLYMNYYWLYQSMNNIFLVRATNDCAGPVGTSPMW